MYAIFQTGAMPAPICEKCVRDAEILVVEVMYGITIVQYAKK